MADKFFGWVTSMLDLPTETVKGRSLIELIDDQRLLVENHLGVITYDTNMIDIKTKFGQLCVEGRDLLMAYLTKDKIVITGQITEISLFRG